MRRDRQRDTAKDVARVRNCSQLNSGGINSGQMIIIGKSRYQTLDASVRNMLRTSAAPALVNMMAGR